MKYKKITLGISICSVLFISACKKADEPKAQIKANHAEASAPISAEQPSSEKALMLQAIEKNKKELLKDTCKILNFAAKDQNIISGDLNHDGKNDFLYNYAAVWECDAQVPIFRSGIFIQNKKGTFDLVNVFDTGMLDHMDRVEFNSIQDNIVNGTIPHSEQKVKYFLKNNQLVEVEDPNKKILIQLGQTISANDSPFAAVLDRMSYIADNVECGGFFSDEQAEKSTTIDHYSLRVSGDQVAVLGVYGLTTQDQVKVLGKTVTSETTLAQIKPWFKSGFETSESKDTSNEIGSASEGAATLKHDLMYSVRDKNSENVVLFYFFKGKLVGVQYFIPC